MLSNLDDVYILRNPVVAPPACFADQLKAYGLYNRGNNTTLLSIWPSEGHFRSGEGSCSRPPFVVTFRVDE